MQLENYLAKLNVLNIKINLTYIANIENNDLFSHIYNEEYLLPFWLNHHKNIFDHGVIIDNFLMTIAQNYKFNCSRLGSSSGCKKI